MQALKFVWLHEHFFISSKHWSHGTVVVFVWILRDFLQGLKLRNNGINIKLPIVYHSVPSDDPNEIRIQKFSAILMVQNSERVVVYHCICIKIRKEQKNFIKKLFQKL